MVQNKIEVRFGDHLDMLFHKHNKSIHLNAGYGLHVRPLNSAEFDYICKKHHGVIHDVIMFGKAAGAWTVVCQALRGGYSMAVGCNTLARCVSRAHAPSG
eukprot:3841878-Pleurochrysis_carterae.AAC.3